MKNTLLYFAIIYLSCFAFDGNAQRFIPLAENDASLLDNQHGPDAAVSTMITYENKILFTGRFSNVNQDESMAFAATWDGESFAPIQPILPEITGSSGILDALNSPLGLVLSGRMADLNNIIVISGNGWVTLGEGFDNTVFDIIWFNNQLYASGRFLSSGTTPTAYVARWNGNAWEAVDGGMDGNVYDLEVYNNQLYAVGAFSMAGSQACSRIARLNGNTWEAVGDGFSDDAYCMSLIDDELYIGGAFETDASASNNFYGLCAYDGTNFSALHTGPETFDVASIVELNNSIIVSERGPQFTSFLTKSNSKKLINNSLEDLLAAWPEVHHVLTWNNATYTSRTMADVLDIGSVFYSGNALFKFAPSGTLNAFITTEEVNALVYPSATMFNEPSLSNAAYFVGNNTPEVSSIYAAAPWITALAQGDETIYSNFQTYNIAEGTQKFYFGPFSDEYNADYIEKYLQVWSLSAEEVDEHISMYDTPGYSVPDAILTWPGNGRLEHDESLHLAPFEDTNMNGLYEPELGDYPVIRGDRCVFYILSTNREGINTNDLGLELMVMLYAYDETPSTIYLNYQLNNLSNNDYEDVKLGMWTDGDIGNFTDDHFGSSPENNFYYFYNGDNFDEASAGSPGFGETPPMQAVSFLDREMSHCMTYSSGPSPINGEPTMTAHYYNYLHGVWKDGSPLLFGGNGTEMGNGDPENPTTFMYPSDPNLPAGDGVWSEVSEGFVPGDRRAVGSFEPLALPAGETLTFDIAFISAQQDGPLDSASENFDNLLNTNQETVDFFDLIEFDAPDTFPVGLNEHDDATAALILYPNPCEEYFSISSTRTGIQKLIIRNLQGKVVEQIDALHELTNINISKLSRGTYMVHLIDDEGNMVSQMLIKK